MPEYMLDTDTVSFALRGLGRVAARLPEQRPSQLCLNSITLADLRLRCREPTPIGTFDTLMAAHALSLGLTFVTNNTERLAQVAALCARMSETVRALEITEQGETG